MLAIIQIFTKISLLMNVLERRNLLLMIYSISILLKNGNPNPQEK